MSTRWNASETCAPCCMPGEKGRPPPAGRDRSRAVVRRPAPRAALGGSHQRHVAAAARWTRAVCTRARWRRLAGRRDPRTTHRRRAPPRPRPRPDPDRRTRERCDRPGRPAVRIAVPDPRDARPRAPPVRAPGAAVREGRAHRRRAVPAPRPSCAPPARRDHRSLRRQRRRHAAGPRTARTRRRHRPAHRRRLQRRPRDLRAGPRANSKRCSSSSASAWTCIEKRAAEAVHGKERLLQARLQAGAALNAAPGARRLTAAVAEFLVEHWQHHLLQTLLREGRESPKHADVLALADALIVVDGLAAQARGGVVADRLIALQPAIVECLVACGHDEHGATDWLAGARARARATRPAAQRAQPPAAACRRRGYRAGRAARGRRPCRPRLRSEVAERMRQLAPGEWLRLLDHRASMWPRRSPGSVP